MEVPADLRFLPLPAAALAAWEVSAGVAGSPAPEATETVVVAASAVLTAAFHPLVVWAVGQAAGGMVSLAAPQVAAAAAAMAVVAAVRHMLAAGAGVARAA